jgi:hypothetical protein
MRSAWRTRKTGERTRNTGGRRRNTGGTGGRPVFRPASRRPGFREALPVAAGAGLVPAPLGRPGTETGGTARKTGQETGGGVRGQALGRVAGEAAARSDSRFQEQDDGGSAIVGRRIDRPKPLIEHNTIIVKDFRPGGESGSIERGHGCPAPGGSRLRAERAVHARPRRISSLPSALPSLGGRA